MRRLLQHSGELRLGAFVIASGEGLLGTPDEGRLGADDAVRSEAFLRARRRGTARPSGGESGFSRFLQTHAPGTCDAATGACSNPPKPDGATCSGGTCMGGACVSSTGASTAAATSSATTTAATTAGAGGMAATTGAGGSGAASPEPTDGCSCRVSNESSPRGALVMGLVALIAIRRRKRARLGAK